MTSWESIAIHVLDYRDTEHLMLISDPSGLPAVLFHHLGESSVKSIISSTIVLYGKLARRRR
jgi:hypothetical protein